jgi:hypothetical protein
MTKDPARLLRADSEADTLERDLLASLQRISVPADAKATAWQGVALGIAAAAAGTSATAAAAASGSALGSLTGAKTLLSASLWSTTTKLALTLALLGASAGSAYWLQQRPTPRPAPRVDAPRVDTPRIAAPASATRAEAAPLPAAEARPLSSRPHRAQHQSAAKTAFKSAGESRLAAESALLQAARARLRNGDALGAQAALDQLRKQFPDGVLVQERDVLGIEVLRARGDNDAARRAAQAFVAANPHSPHTAALRPLLTEP